MTVFQKAQIMSRIKRNNNYVISFNTLGMQSVKPVYILRFLKCVYCKSITVLQNIQYKVQRIVEHNNLNNPLNLPHKQF